MNNYFRIIKENQNLDLLEESDDEDIFENIDTDKFLKTEDFIPMICYYESKLQKWVPIKKTNKEANIVSYDKLNKLYVINKLIIKLIKVINYINLYVYYQPYSI